MFRLVRTTAQARQGLLSVVILPCGVGGIDQLESFDFLTEEIAIRHVEIFAIGKIAECPQFS